MSNDKKVNDMELDTPPEDKKDNETKKKVSKPKPKPKQYSKSEIEAGIIKAHNKYTTDVYEVQWLKIEYRKTAMRELDKGDDVTNVSEFLDSIFNYLKATVESKGVSVNDFMSFHNIVSSMF